jgi:DNA modification methylase
LLLDDYEEVDAADYPQFIQTMATEVFRVLKPNAWGIWWLGIEWYRMIRDVLEATGFDIDPIPGIWAKDRGQTNRPELYMARSYEAFIVIRKGTPIFPKQGRLNVFSFSIGDSSKKIHATEKPLALMKELFSTFLLPGARIISPFLGSGVDITAAILLHMKCFGYDSNQKHKDRFVTAMSQIFGEEEAKEEEEKACGEETTRRGDETLAIAEKNAIKAKVILAQMSTGGTLQGANSDIDDYLSLEEEKRLLREEQDNVTND